MRLEPPQFSHTFRFRVRYAETDQMGTFYNARALEWFEVGRSELSYAMGLPYREWEARGVYLPLVEAHVFYRGRASYDDEIEMAVWVERAGRVRLKFFNQLKLVSTGLLVCEGYTIHALVNREGRPVRLPPWLAKLVESFETTA